MHYLEVNSHVQAALDEERRAYAARGRSIGALGSLNIGLQSLPNNGWTELGKVSEILFPNSDPGAISSPTATLLIKFYSALTEQERVYFRIFLLGEWHDEIELTRRVTAILSEDGTIKPTMLLPP